jgi:succinate dehydrogenase / fumarate reductase cytochrome b subunit
MAVTGLSFVTFVTGHMAGNLTAYYSIWERMKGIAPGTMMNEYAEFLQGFAHGFGIWGVRAGLAGLLCLHVWAALTLTLDNWAARPKGYKMHKVQATWSSRTMRYTACVLFCFVIYHLLHLTLGWLNNLGPLGTGVEFVKADAFQNFVRGFQNPIHSAIYIIVNCCLFLHLRHGIWSFTQTLGLAHPKYDLVRKYGAILWALAVAGINISYPLAVLSGILKIQ